MLNLPPYSQLGIAPYLQFGSGYQIKKQQQFRVLPFMSLHAEVCEGFAVIRGWPQPKTLLWKIRTAEIESGLILPVLDFSKYKRLLWQTVHARDRDLAGRQDIL